RGPHRRVTSSCDLAAAPFARARRSCIIETVMARSLFKIAGGTVYDPAHGIDGEQRDLWIEGGKLVAPPTDPLERPERTLDATGLVVMPGGVDMHSHIAGPKVNVARRMQPDDKRQAPPVLRTATTHSGTLGSVPST